MKAMCDKEVTEGGSGILIVMLKNVSESVLKGVSCIEGDAVMLSCCFIIPTT